LTASVEALQSSLASEQEAHAKLQQQLSVASVEATATAKETETREKTAAAENEKLRMLLVDASREVQAASEGRMSFSQLVCNILLYMRVPIAYQLYLNNVAAMAAVPKAFATAADIRIRAMSFLHRRQNMQLMLTSFSGVLIPQCCHFSSFLL
jgi:hypothetical protein